MADLTDENRKDVRDLLAAGVSERDIADAVGISIDDVKGLRAAPSPTPPILEYLRATYGTLPAGPTSTTSPTTDWQRLAERQAEQDEFEDDYG